MVVNNNHAQFSSVDVEGYARKLSTKEQTSGIIWVAISIVQLFLGFFFTWWIFAVGIINMITAIGSFKKAKRVLTPYQGMVEEYDKQLVFLIIALAYNLLIGGIIGVVGNIYDVTTRNFVLENKHIFVRAAGGNTAQQSTRKSSIVSRSPQIDPGAYASRTNNPATWACSCGRVNPSYVTSCVCGTSKHKR